MFCDDSMTNSKIIQMPTKLLRKLTAIVGLHLFDGKLQSMFYLVDDVSLQQAKQPVICG